MKKVGMLTLLLLGLLFNCASVSVAKENTIEIAMATDNNYAYPTMVAMTSILESKNDTTKVNFHVMLSSDFDSANKEKIKSLEKTYSGCAVDIIDMKPVQAEAKTSGHITKSAYFRLSLASLLQDLDKVLYLDTDLIAVKDISDLYSTNIDNYYVGGMNHGGLKNINKNFFGLGRREIYINSGVLLMNLKKMREDNIEEKFNQFMIEHQNDKEWRQHDQDVINAVCYGNIAILPLKYNAMQQDACQEGLRHWYSDTYEESYQNPAIIHYSSPDKPWNLTNLKNADLWWECARRSKFYSEIKEKFLPKSAEDEEVQVH